MAYRFRTELKYSDVPQKEVWLNRRNLMKPPVEPWLQGR